MASSAEYLEQFGSILNVKNFGITKNARVDTVFKAAQGGNFQ